MVYTGLEVKPTVKYIGEWDCENIDTIIFIVSLYQYFNFWVD